MYDVWTAELTAQALEDILVVDLRPIWYLAQGYNCPFFRKIGPVPKFGPSTRIGLPPPKFGLVNQISKSTEENLIVF